MTRQTRVSIVSAYIREVNENQEEIHGEMRSFWEHELSDLWPVFQNAKRIIGFNSLKFDVPVLTRMYQQTSHLLSSLTSTS